MKSRSLLPVPLARCAEGLGLWRPSATLGLLESSIEFEHAAFRQSDELRGEPREPVGVIHSSLMQIRAMDFIWVRLRIDFENFPPFSLPSIFLLAADSRLPPILSSPPLVRCALCDSYQVNKPPEQQ